MRKRVLVLGGNFGGLTAALSVKHELHGDVDVRVVSASDHFLFSPSLIWLPSGKRRPQDITFPLARTFEILGGEPTEHEEFGDIPAVCVMDAGNDGVMILADKMLPPRRGGVLIPGPQAHGAKLLFEKYYLWKSRHGYVRLP